MEFIQDLAGSFFWAFALGLILAIAGSIAVGFIVKKSDLLKPLGPGLKIIVFFISIQLFLFLGVAEHYPRLSKYVNFYSWLVFIFALFRVGLYIYGDLFIVRLKHGSFPAAFKNSITVFVVVVATLILLKEILNINVTSLIATTTVLTATIGLAFQSTLANMLAGLTIHLEKPLRQGDWISVAGHEGRVMDITLRSTRIMTIENNEVVIPNSKILAEAVINYSLPDTATVRKLSVGVSYSIPPNKVKGAVMTVLSGIEGVERHPAPRVRVLHYGDFSVNYEIRYAINDFSRYLETDADIMDLLWYRFKRDGIEIPFPVRDVHLRQITEQTRQVEQERREDRLMVLMGNVDILSPLSTTELKILAKTVRDEYYAAGEFPVRQGDAGDSFYIIKQGNVDVIVDKSSGGTAMVATLGPGDFFGEMSLLTGEARSASIRVKEDAEFIVIDKASFRSTLVNNPAIAESMSHILAKRQAGLEAERERPGASAPGGRKDTSGRLLERIREFFGLKR